MSDSPAPTAAIRWRGNRIDVELAVFFSYHDQSPVVCAALLLCPRRAPLCTFPNLRQDMSPARVHAFRAISKFGWNDSHCAVHTLSVIPFSSVNRYCTFEMTERHEKWSGISSNAGGLIACPAPRNGRRCFPNPYTTSRLATARFSSTSMFHRESRCEIPIAPESSQKQFRSRLRSSLLSQFLTSVFLFCTYRHHFSSTRLLSWFAS